MRRKQHQVFETLQAEIRAGRYKQGDLLPAEETLARQYGVSRPTVAKAYNQLQQAGYIKKTRGFGSQVLYTSADRQYTIGLLLPGSGESEIFTVINDQLLQLSGRYPIHCLWEGATASDATIRRAQIGQHCAGYIARKVDAILFSPLERVPDADAINRNIYDRIIAADIPLILIDRGIKGQPETGGYDRIGVDNLSAGSVMAAHLLEKGCTTLYFFYRPNSANSVDIRLAGAREAVLSRQLPFTESHVFCGEPDDLDFLRTIPVVPGKTGIICANDSTATVLLDSLEKIGLKTGEDCLVCGFDNMKYAQYLKYPLTSYQQPCEEIANISMELALRRIRNHQQIPMTVTVQGKLVERASTNFRRN